MGARIALMASAIAMAIPATAIADRQSPPTAKVKPTPLSGADKDKRYANNLWRSYGKAKKRGSEASWCKRRLRLRTDLMDCSVRLTAAGQALVISATEDCRGCIPEVWVLRRKHRQKVGEDDWAQMVLTPDYRYAYVGITRQTVSKFHMALYRYDMKLKGNKRKKQRSKLAACMLPRLSPGGTWIVCRDRRGNVLRIALASGKTEQFWTRKKTLRVDLNRHMGLGLSAVSFIGTDKMSFTTVNSRKKTERVTAAWNE